MKDDTSAIPRTGCNVISDSAHIRNYDGNIYSDYYLMGDTWVKNSQNSTNYPQNISNYVCINPDDLHSQYSYMYPIYQTITLTVVCALFAFLYWLIFRPLIWGSNG